jgi:uncharacterized integral membrane protein
VWVIRTILVLIIVAVVVGFSIYNANQRVSIDLIRTRYDNVLLIVAMYWAFLVGMVVSALLGMTYVIRLHGDLRTQRRARKRLEMEMGALRNRSIEELEKL